MSAAPAARLRSVRDAGERATSLELFFDLVYVLAFIQVTHLMAEGSNVSSVFGGLAVLGVLWWSWASHAWLANQSAADRGVARIGILIAIAIVLVLSVAIPEVYPRAGESRFGALLFAGGFVVLSLVYAAVNVLLAGRNVAFRHQVIRTMAVTIVPVSAALLVGALVGGFAQILLWLGAVFIEGATVFLTSRGGEWQLPSAAHYAERHGLVVILALGESIISIGLGAAHSALTVPVVAGCVLAVFVALAMWWNYFDRLSAAAERGIHALYGAQRATVAAIGTYLHLGIVAGILLVSLGLGGAIKHIDDARSLGLFGAVTLAAGLALFFIATSMYRWTADGNSPRRRLGAAALAVAATPLLAAVTSLASIAVILAFPLGVAAIDYATTRGLIAPGRQDARERVPPSRSTSPGRVGEW